jgi:hypothetical protein
VEDSWNKAIDEMRAANSVAPGLRRYRLGQTTFGMLETAIHEAFWPDWDRLKAAWGELVEDPDEYVRTSATDWLRSIATYQARVVDLDSVRRGSFLRPGANLILSGGYSPAQPWWLQGRTHYEASFVGFLSVDEGEMPVAIVEFTETLNLVRADGHKHSGRYGLLNLSFIDNDWTKPPQRVEVFVVKHPPDDAYHFRARFPEADSVESHAVLDIAPAKGGGHAGT